MREKTKFKNECLNIRDLGKQVFESGVNLQLMPVHKKAHLVTAVQTHDVLLKRMKTVNRKTMMFSNRMSDRVNNVRMAVEKLERNIQKMK